MKTLPLNEARASFSNLFERALSGEPQRVTRYGKEAVIVVSEADWRARQRGASSLGALLAAQAREGLFAEPMGDRPWSERELGADLA